MDKPTRCDLCPFFECDYYKKKICHKKNREIEINVSEGTPDWCPIEEGGIHTADLKDDQ